MIRENHAEIGSRRVIWLDTSVASREALEKSLEEVASQVRDSLLDGNDVELRTPERSLDLVGPGALRVGLRFLAGVGMTTTGHDYDPGGRAPLAPVANSGARRTG